MRIHRHVAKDNEVFLAIDGLLALGFHRGLGEEAFARRNVEEANIIEDGMAFGFHSGIKEFRSTLTSLVAGLDFVDDIDLAATTNDLAGRVTLLGGFDGRHDFHKRDQNRVHPPLCQLKCP